MLGFFPLSEVFVLKSLFETTFLPVAVCNVFAVSLFVSSIIFLHVLVNNQTALKP